MVVVLATMGLAACDSPFTPASATVSLVDDAGVEDAGERTIAPASAGEPVEYRVSGTGPNGASFLETVAALPLDVGELVAGEWEIRVEGLDGVGAVVLEGTTVAHVSLEGNTPVQVTLAPQAGDGSVALSIDWPAAHVCAPTVNAVLHRDGFDPVILGANVASETGTATVTGTTVPAGWYRLQLRLYDGTSLVAGCAELLQVRADTTTTAAITLSELNKPGEAVTVTGSSFTLAWDRSATADPADPVASYNVYYRVHGTYAWTLLGSTGTLTESFTVTSALLDYGVYDFAVTSVTTTGAESEPHTSLDDDADPQTGWFVDWGM